MLKSLLLSASICGIAGTAIAEPASYFMDYLKVEDQRQHSVGYLYGLRDGLTQMQAAYLNMNAENRVFYCIPEGYDILHWEIEELLKNELANDSSLLEEEILIVFLMAMVRRFPC